MEDCHILSDKAVVQDLNNDVDALTAAAAGVPCGRTTFSLRSFNLGFGTLKAGRSGFYHRHSDFQVQFVSQGIVYFNSRKLSVKLNNDKLLLIPPRLDHRWQADEGAILIGLAFGIDGEEGRAKEKALTRQSGNDIWTEERTSRFNMLWSLLVDILALREIRREEEVSSLLRAWFCELLHNSFSTEVLFGGDGSEYKASAKRFSPEQQVVEMGKRIIREAIDQPIKMEEVAQKAGKSARQFYRLFKQQTGITPYKYLEQIRLSLARTLVVRDIDMPLKQVAAHCGFRQLSHFTDKFKKTFGSTPKEFRKQQREK